MTHIKTIIKCKCISWISNLISIFFYFRFQIHFMSQQMELPKIFSKCGRLCCDYNLLYRLLPPSALVPHKECRCVRVLQHHQDPSPVQACPAFLRFKDPSTDLPCICQGANVTCGVPCSRYCHFRQPSLLC